MSKDMQCLYRIRVQFNPLAPLPLAPLPASRSVCGQGADRPEKLQDAAASLLRAACTGLLARDIRGQDQGSLSKDMQCVYRCVYGQGWNLDRLQNKGGPAYLLRAARTVLRERDIQLSDQGCMPEDMQCLRRFRLRVQFNWHSGYAPLPDSRVWRF